MRADPLLLPGTLNGFQRPLAHRPAPAVARFYVNNRRDGSRLLSSAVVITVIGLIRCDTLAGQVIALIAGLLSLYWWQCYRQLQQ
jgi:hypothetical protein